MKPNTINVYERKLWPQCVQKQSEIPCVLQEIKRIVELVKNIYGEGFEDMQHGEEGDFLFDISSGRTHV